MPTPSDIEVGNARDEIVPEIWRAQALPDFLETWRADDRVKGCLVTEHVVPASEAELREIPAWLDPRLRTALEGRGITQLYSHQAEALEAARSGEHVMLVTPTASGKSLCYNLPALQGLAERPDSRALYVFPTKALTADQYTELHALASTSELGVGVFPFDGDTPQHARQAIRTHGHIVLTNPDMLHSGVLPNHTKWMRLFAGLETIVLDEVHTYRGIFGSHVANVLRRLRRIAAFYGSRPRFVLCSATLRNAKEFAETLLEAPARVIDRSGAPRAEKRIYFYNPPVVNAELGIRASYIHETRRLAERLILCDIPTIVFAASRLNVEVLLKYLHDGLRKHHKPERLVQGYRGGYLPEHRRRIERGLREGEVRGVVSTNALELGIDIGTLEASVIAGYPGTVASFWQQAGRAGRKGGLSATILVARSHPLDQYVVNHPERLLESPPEVARIAPDNLFVLVDHLKCAAYELAFRDGEGFGRVPAEEVKTILDHLVDHEVLHRSEGPDGATYHWMAEAFPAQNVSLRSMPGENFVVIEMPQDRIIAEVDYHATPTMLHEHAITHVDGRQYEVVRLDWDNHKAYVRAVEPDYFTDAMTYVRVEVLDEAEGQTGGAPEGNGVRVAHGEVSVTEKVVGFKKVRFYSHENVGFGEVFLPEQTRHTTSLWWHFSGARLFALPYPPAEILDALSGLGHLLAQIAAVEVWADGRDLAHCVGERTGQWSYRSTAERPPQRGSGPKVTPEIPLPGLDPCLFIYETYPGGVGLSKALFDRARFLMAAARAVVAACPCNAGCPSCIGPPAPLAEHERKKGSSAATRTKTIALEVAMLALALAEAEIASSERLAHAAAS